MPQSVIPIQEADDLDGENGNAPVAVKKKLPKVEENKSKKEHVNVVFIGHVGKCRAIIRDCHLSDLATKCISICACNK